MIIDTGSTVGIAIAVTTMIVLITQATTSVVSSSPSLCFGRARNVGAIKDSLRREANFESVNVVGGSGQIPLSVLLALGVVVTEAVRVARAARDVRHTASGGAVDCRIGATGLVARAAAHNGGASRLAIALVNVGPLWQTLALVELQPARYCGH